MARGGAERRTRMLFDTGSSVQLVTSTMLKTTVMPTKMILELGVAKRSGAQIIWPAEGSNNVQYLLLKGDIHWYGTDVVDALQQIRTINAKQTKQSVKDCMNDFTVLQLSMMAVVEAVVQRVCYPQ